MTNDFFQKVEQAKGVPNFFWEITRRCNQNCPICYLPPHSNDNEEIQLNLVPKLVNELRALHCLIVTLSGGEPFLRSDIIDIVRCFREAGTGVVIFSNGSVIDRFHLESLANLGLLRLEITVFALCPEIAVKMGCENIQKVVSTIELARQLNIRVAVKTPVTKVNLEDLPKISEWCERIGAEHNIDPLIQSTENGRTNLPWLLPPGQTAKILGRITSACGVGPGTLTMRWDGTVVPCLTTPIVLGKWPDRNLQEILHAPATEATWCKLREMERPCISCNNYLNCPRCPGLFWSEASGKPWNYLCQVAEHIGRNFPSS